MIASCNVWLRHVPQNYLMPCWSTSSCCSRCVDQSDSRISRFSSLDFITSHTFESRQFVNSLLIHWSIDSFPQLFLTSIIPFLHSRIMARQTRPVRQPCLCQHLRPWLHAPPKPLLHSLRCSPSPSLPLPPSIHTYVSVTIYLFVCRLPL